MLKRTSLNNPYMEDMEAVNVYMDNALNYAKLSKCVRLQVGCVIVNENGRTISTGVNGSGKGQVNCNEVDHGPNNCHHHEWSKINEIHAESNAIFNLIGSTVPKVMSFYITHSPCQQCLSNIVALAANFNIIVPSIVFNEKYDRLTDEELQAQKEFCRRHGVQLVGMDELNV